MAKDMYKIMSALTIAVLAAAFYLNASAKSDIAIATNQNNDDCNEQFVYTKSGDFDDNRVNINFESSDEQIDVSAKTGYSVIRVELDVESDGHSGYHTYATGPVNNFNPNPGGDIDSAKITVKKVCATSTPTPTVTPTVTPYVAPTVEPTATPAPEVTPSVDPTPTPIDCEQNPQADICIEIDCPGQGECEVVIGDVSPTPSTEPTQAPASPTPTQGGQGGTGSTSSSSSSNNSTSETKNDVASVTAFANTGAFKEVLSNGLLVLGTAMSGISFALYGKKKKTVQK